MLAVGVDAHSRSRALWRCAQSSTSATPLNLASAPGSPTCMHPRQAQSNAGAPSTRRFAAGATNAPQRAVRRGEGRLCRRLARGKYVRVSWTSVLHCAPSAHALSIKADNRAVSRAARFAILAWRHSCAQAAPAPVNRTRSGRHDGANTPRQTGGAVSRAAFGLLLWWCNRAVRTCFCADPVPPSRGWRRQGAAPTAIRARGSAAASLSN